MDVIEQIEIRFRREILAVIDLPGPSPARLFAVLKQAFSLLESLPILQFLTGSDYDLLFRRLPAEILQEHMSSDIRFIEDLVAHCRQAGIPIQAQPEQIIGLLYPLVLTALHKMRWYGATSTAALMCSWSCAAYCLGEVALQPSR